MKTPEGRSAFLKERSVGGHGLALNREGKFADSLHIDQAEKAIHVFNSPSSTAAAAFAIGAKIAKMAAAALGGPIKDPS